jgi:hypothetical protein
MTPQKSERRVVPQGRRKSVSTRSVERSEGGKAPPVNKRTGQIGLRFETAEEPATRVTGADGGADVVLSTPAPTAVPKSKRKEKTVASATMEEVCARLAWAFQNVAANRGAPGPDRQSIDQVRVHLPELLSALRNALLEGHYE